MVDITSDDLCVAVIGAGAMGQGIAQVSCVGGIRTLLFDANGDASKKARETLVKRIDRLVEKGRMTPEEAQAAAENLHVAQSIDELSTADVVIEAVFEDLEIKKDVFRKVESVVSPECILATNTSSIPVAAIAFDLAHKDRCGGMHFFNPVPLMKLVEIVKAPETSQSTVQALTQLGKRFTRVPVSVKDAPGFLVNAGGRAYTTEGLRIAHEGVATPAEIDAIMRDCAGFRMGPFELMDLTGIDVNFPVSKLIYDGYMQDERFRTSPLHEELFNAGRYGRKTKRGHFSYNDANEKVDPPSPDFAPDDASPIKKFGYAGEPYLLEPFASELGVELVHEADTDDDVPIVCAPMGEDATEFSLRNHVSHKSLVAIDLTGNTSTRVTLMTTPGAEPAYLNKVAATIIASGRKVTAIKDSPGFVAQRMRAMVGNLGCYLAEIGLASPSDIDTAMKLGLNYPLGPLEIITDLGAMESFTILKNIQDITGEDRYRPTLWLRRRAELGLPIDTPA